MNLFGKMLLPEEGAERYIETLETEPLSDKSAAPFLKEAAEKAESIPEIRTLEKETEKISLPEYASSGAEEHFFQGARQGEDAPVFGGGEEMLSETGAETFENMLWEDFSEWGQEVFREYLPEESAGVFSGGFSDSMSESFSETEETDAPFSEDGLPFFADVYRAGEETAQELLYRSGGRPIRPETVWREVRSGKKWGENALPFSEVESVPFPGKGEADEEKESRTDGLTGRGLTEDAFDFPLDSAEERLLDRLEKRLGEEVALSAEGLYL